MRPNPPAWHSCARRRPLWKGGGGSQESRDADRQSGKTKTHEKAEGTKKLASDHAFCLRRNQNPHQLPQFLQSCRLRAHVRWGAFQVRLRLAEFLPANYISGVLSFGYK